MIMCGNVCAARTFNCAAVERWTEISCSTFHVCTPICRCECAFLAEWERSRDKRKKKIQRTLKFFDLNWICRRARRKHWPIPWTNRYTTFFSLSLHWIIWSVLPVFHSECHRVFNMKKTGVFRECDSSNWEAMREEHWGKKSQSHSILYDNKNNSVLFVASISIWERERENCIIINMNSMDLI